LTKLAIRKPMEKIESVEKIKAKIKRKIFPIKLQIKNNFSHQIKVIKNQLP